MVKRHWKRIAALALAACLLIGVIPARSSAAATAKTYNLNMVSKKLTSSGKTVASSSTALNLSYTLYDWKWEGSSITSANSLRFYEAGLVALSTVSNWIAIRIKAPDTDGLYTVSLEYAAHPYNGTAAIYVLPGNTTDIAAALTQQNRLGTVNLWEEDQTGTANYTNNFSTYTACAGTCQLTADQEYIVVMESVETSPYHTTRSYMTASALTLTSGDVFTEQEVQAIAKPVVANPGPVTLLEGCYYGTTLQADGKDYMFEPVEGGKLLAFDMDSFVRKYEVDIPFLTARGITADDSGDLWICGDNKFLYRYNPVTHEGEQTKSFEDIDPGVSTGFDMVYADGCLYFGTNPTGSIIQYDIANETFTRLYTHGGSYSNGIVYQDGYVYAGIYDVRDSANESWTAVKINVNDTSDVTSVAIVDKMPKGGMFYDAGLAGDLLLFGGGQNITEFVAIDINTMEPVELGITGGIQCSITEEVDGKVYFVLNSGPQGTGLYALDVQTGTLSKRLIYTTRGLRCADRSIIQVDDENYPGNNIAVYAPATGEPMLYNLEKKITKRGLELIEDYGTATYIRSLTNGADGDIYIGAFNTSNCSVYNTGASTFTKFATQGQTDSMCWYGGDLYVGNYPDGAIVRVDLENAGNNEILLKLNDDVYDQARIHTLTAGDDKIFAGTTPDKGSYGGCLAWVDIATGETYAERNIVQDQTINCIVYQDGLIYGTTSIYGGTSSVKRTDLSAKLFVYDVAGKAKLAEFDLKAPLGFEANIEFFSGIVADPNVPGKFWGLVSETLFSFTYDMATNEITVKEELSYKKDSYNTGGGRSWFPKPFCFDGKGNLYLSFENNGGVRRINVKNVSDNTRLAIPSVLYYTLGKDGNLYYGVGETLYAYPLEVSDADWELPAALDQQIRAIGTPVTLDDASVILAAKEDYDQLDLAHKALVQCADVLERAEAALLDLQIQDLNNISPSVYKAQVLSLYERYRQLTDQQKSTIKNRPCLFVAYDALDDIVCAVDGTYCVSLAQALEIALCSDNKTVIMIEDIREEILLTDGVVLDLNGHTLTADAFRANLPGTAQGFVVDSSHGNSGLLKTAQGEDLFSPGNPDIPLYDAAAGGYRLFDYTLELHSNAQEVDADRQKFWFKFHFRTDDSGESALDQDAYDLVKTGNSNFTVSTRLTWKDATLPQVYFGMNRSVDAFSKAWAEGATASRWLYIIVSGLDDVSAGTLTVKPVLMANGVEVTGGTVSYQKELGGSGGWSDIGPANP